MQLAVAPLVQPCDILVRSPCFSLWDAGCECYRLFPHGVTFVVLTAKSADWMIFFAMTEALGMFSPVLLDTFEMGCMFCASAIC
jgi:hypothetical protein